MFTSDVWTASASPRWSLRLREEYGMQADDLGIEKL
jgi:hypothetical protein